MQNDLEIILNFHTFDINLYQNKLIDYLEMVYMSNIIIENNLDLLFLQLAKNDNIYYLNNELPIEIETINNVFYYKILSKKKIISKIKKKLKDDKINFIILPILLIEKRNQEFFQNFIIFDKCKNMVFKYGKILETDDKINNFLLKFINHNFENFEYKIIFDSNQDKVISLHKMLSTFFDSDYNEVSESSFYSYFLKNCYDFIFNDLWFENLDICSYHRLILDSTNLEIQQNTLKKLLKENNSYIINISLDGLTCLELACQKGLYDFSKILIDNGANINTKSEYGLNSPLHLAIKFNKNLNSNHNKIIKYLLEKNVDINSNDESSTTPLFTAAAKNDIETFKMLLDKGADINTKTITNKNIIHYMCCSPEFFKINKINFDLLNILIDHGIKLEDCDINNCNTLHLACKYLNNNLVEWIMQMNNKLELNMLNQKNSSGFTPLDTAKNTKINFDQLNSYIDNLNILIESNFANINLSDNEKSAELKIINYFLLQQQNIVNNLENIIL